MIFSRVRALAGVDTWNDLGILARNGRRMRAWLDAGKPVPVPHPVKVRNIVAVAQIFGLRTLVETGTQAGATLAATRDYFDRLYSIEIYEPAVIAARKRFEACPKITIIQGDSATELPKLIAKIDEPILFWLDGHFSGKGTGKGEEESPIVREIDHILKLRPPGRDAIIIDDARMFEGRDGYPPLEKFIEDVRAAFGLTPRHADDAIFILPR